MKATPILISVRDLVSPLRELVTVLEAHGCERLVLVDNDSRFEPMVDYLRTSPHEVIRLGRNVGPRSFWEVGVVDQVAPHGPYVVTDPDVVPDERCPADFLERFDELLARYLDVAKVGFGLRVDDLPESYSFRDEAAAHEAQFWVDEIEPSVYRANIDTTFALYRSACRSFNLSALRTGPPYVARHLAWYADSAHPTDEELYYRRHARRDGNTSTWGHESLPQSLLVSLGRASPPSMALPARLWRTVRRRLGRPSGSWG